MRFGPENRSKTRYDYGVAEPVPVMMYGAPQPMVYGSVYQSQPASVVAAPAPVVA
jgi:hypothetical protein